MGKGASSSECVPMGLSIGATDSEILFRLQSAGRVGLEHDYTHIYPLNNVGMLSSSALLVGPGGKEYRGHVGAMVAEGRIAEQAGVPQGDVVFVGWTTYGKVDGTHHGRVSYSTDLDETLKGVNKTLRSKLTPRKGYLPQGEGPEQISRQDVLSGMGQMEVNGWL